MKYALLLFFLCPAALFAQTGLLTFRVDMSLQTVSPQGVHVAGDFQSLTPGGGGNWDPAALELTDGDHDNIYEVTVTLPAGTYRYKFINGTTWPTSELVPASCGVSDGGGNVNRQVVFNSPAAQTPLYCFSACTSCDSSINTTYTTRWWNDAVFYEVFVRSFFDNDGNGRGDFSGLMAKLDYLNDGNPATTTDLGVTGIWLMPIMPSPSYHGYDVTNYKDIETDYGNMAQFDAFLAAAHQRGIKVIIDLVLNHTASQHPWFTQSASDTAGPFRNWYIWSPTNPNYQGPWGQQVWHQRNGQYYYGLFTGSMPDLNWSNPAVKTAMWDVVRFWMNKGVDGFRLDAIKYLDENGRTMENTPETFALLEEFADTVKAANPEGFTMGEAWSSTDQVVPYTQNDRLNACFEFDLAGAILGAVNGGDPTSLLGQLVRVDNAYPKLQFGTFLTNHDQNRAFTELGNDVDKMKLAASLYLTMPGIPFLYYGEEVAMTGQGGDENKRTPMQWTPGPRGGFTTGNPWRAVNSNYLTNNVETMQADPNSLLSHYKKLIAIRNGSEALRRGYTLPMAVSNPSAEMAYARIYGQEAVVVASNFGASGGGTRLTLRVSTLGAGDYVATDLWTGLPAGTVRVNAQGGFTEWVPNMAGFASRETWVLRLSPATAARKGSALSLQVLPNPASGRVQIQLAKDPGARTTVRVFDVTGRPVLTERFRGAGHSLNTEALRPGAYLVQVQNRDGMATERLSIVR